MGASSLPRRILTLIWGDWQTNELWQRILKYGICITICIILAILPQSASIFGRNTHLIPMTTVFAHPGQRMGRMLESLVMVIFGSLLGVAWALLGLQMFSLLVESNPSAAYAVRALFFLVSILFHGYVRSSTPRLFTFVWLMLTASIPIFLGSAQAPSTAVFTGTYVPILTSGAVLVVTNIFIFPELSTSYLGSTTIQSLDETMKTLERASHWFVTPGGDSDEIERPEEDSSTKVNGRLSKFFADFQNPFQTSNSKSKTEDTPVHLITLARLTEGKTKLRAAFQRCRAAQDEVNFEISLSPLPPKSLRPISKQCMSRLVHSTITLIGACENKFVVLNNSDVEEYGEDDTGTAPESTDNLLRDPETPTSMEQNDGKKKFGRRETFEKKIQEVKPVRALESGSAEHLEFILKRLRDPVQEFEASLKDASTLVISCLAYCFDVPKLPSGAPTPTGIQLEEIDLRIDLFTDALDRFDDRSTEELKRTAKDSTGAVVDLMPRVETFLVSSFLLGFRQAAMHVLQMLHHARGLVEKRRSRRDRLRLWMPSHADISKWLSTAGEEDGMVLPETARRGARTGQSDTRETQTADTDSLASDDILKHKSRDEEEALGQQNNRTSSQRQNGSSISRPKSAPKKKSRSAGWLKTARGRTADVVEWFQHSDDVKYSIKLAIAVFLVSWPAFVLSWTDWYADVRGNWAPSQLVLVFEVVIGSSFFIFFVRLSGLIYGCVMGYASYEIARGTRAGIVVILALALLPAIYVQLGTKYVKTGITAASTMVVVALAAVNQSGSAVENFYMRLAAFLIGGVVAMFVEVLIYPVRARHRLVESLSTSVRQIQSMQGVLSVGIDSVEKPNFRSPKLLSRFNRARDKAQAALTAAETFMPFCLKEPRLKGSFKPLEPIYREIIYVLHQIIDRMDTVVDLRKEYGSSILEDLNSEVHVYRRNVAASNTLVLFAVNEALTTKLPLPQFLPSTRLAQLRLINRVREVVELRSSGTSKHHLPGDLTIARGQLDDHTASIITQRSFLSWNASTAGQMEIIEYLEELVELTKLLVGVNAFRSGVLEKPKYKEYVQQVTLAQTDLDRIRSVQSGRSRSRSRSRGPEAPGALPSLRQAVNLAAQVAKFRQTMRSRAEEAEVERGQADRLQTEQLEGLPMSLRRVGTRAVRENEAIRRRRGYSTTLRSPLQSP